jgi:hypothetical protein
MSLSHRSRAANAAWRIRLDGINFGSGAKDAAVATAPQSAARERMDHGSRKTPPR